MIMDRQIEERIVALTKEILTLEETHNAMVKQNQQDTQQFQQQVAKNQTRYAQIQGALVELKQLLKPEGNNDEPDVDHLFRGIETSNRKVVN